MSWRTNQSKWQEPKDSPSKNENNSTSPDRGIFWRLYGQPCSVLNVMPKVKERTWRARQFSEIKILNQSKCQQPKDSPSKNKTIQPPLIDGIFSDFMRNPILCAQGNAESKRARLTWIPIPWNQNTEPFKMLIRHAKQVRSKNVVYRNVMLNRECAGSVKIEIKKRASLMWTPMSWNQTTTAIKLIEIQPNPNLQWIQWCWKAMRSYANDVTIQFIFGDLGWPQMYICTNMNRIM